MFPAALQAFFAQHLPTTQDFVGGKAANEIFFCHSGDPGPAAIFFFDCGGWGWPEAPPEMGGRKG